MEQEKLAALVRLIMADPRIMAMLKNDAGGSCDLTLIETKDIFESLPPDWRENVFCQEIPDGGSGFTSLDTALKGEWNRIRICQPSLNVVAKLALGIADEPLLSIVQQKLMEGAENLELLRLCDLSKIKTESYQKLFLGYVEKIRGFGIRVSGDGDQAAADIPAAEKAREAGRPTTGSITWQYKALTERDLLDIEKGSVVTIGRKCIVTSLAVDMARRKSIQICREGEVR